MDQLAGRHGRLDGVEEAKELLVVVVVVAVALHAATEHGSFQHIERGE